MDKVNPTASFGFALLQKEIAQNPNENVLVSPVSVSLALSMVANGAKGDTLTGIAKGLGLSGTTDSFAAQNASYADLLNDLKGSKLGVKLSIASSIFAQSGVEFDQDFLGTCWNEFKAEVEVSDFTDPKTLEAINKWCSDRTDGKITSILDEIDPLIFMHLLSAVYFNGVWTIEFNKNETTDEDFEAATGTKRCPFMCRYGAMEFCRNIDYELVALPFGEAERIKLYVFLPSVGKTPEDMLRVLDNDFYKKALSQLYRHDGSLSLPRFRLEYCNQLDASLAALGMETAFGRTADFSGMGGGFSGVHIKGVQHKTVAIFDEDGCRAAGSEDVGEGFECMPWVVKINRPFVVVIGDSDTGAVIFAGVVYNP